MEKFKNFLYYEWKKIVAVLFVKRLCRSFLSFSSMLYVKDFIVITSYVIKLPP